MIRPMRPFTATPKTMACGRVLDESLISSAIYEKSAESLKVW